MEIEQPPTAAESAPAPVVRVAAAGDVHCREDHREQALEAFAALRGQADVLLLAGDLTTHGEPEEGAVLADACRQLDIPVFAVLGNHDWHVNRAAELTAALREGGITVLERDWAICEVGGVEVGIAGTKGFVGGFPGSHMPDFGEPLLREVYRETQAEVEALDHGLREIALCPLRLVLLHYAPTRETLEGEGEGIMAFLGTDRLAAPLLEHEPTLAVHGHAHAGTFQGRVGTVPVCNVSVPVIGRDFHVFELAADSRAAAPIH
ncbi:metallophosphoesterase [Conexibacter stalactiti]|uniref:Metallophosphoesterase n=1 Tax=Conexibacter stalactiti TaxID=1940611 RepID=A0ABU4HV81_9ACTN|nr:metallophosphoesterase [Conexibacter stalactiti]MDW5596602.1 metallophosphoesterase [Conexibacter stalactiti]MEC5037244.1 metallophosphoesterase [Conexibacter stalactiti]